MKSNIKLFKRHFILLISITIFFASCETVRMNNFNRQKFTYLKPISQQVEPANVESSSISDFGIDDGTDVVLVDQEFGDPISGSDLETESEQEPIDETDSDNLITPLNETIQLDCDTIITASRMIICTIEKIDKKQITFSYCPNTGGVFVIQKADVKYYSGQPVEQIPIKEEPVVKDSISQVEEHLPVDPIKGELVMKDSLSQVDGHLQVVQTSEEEVRYHKALARSYFLFSLICLVFFAIGAALLVFWLGEFLFFFGLILFSISFIVGYTFLAISAYHSRICKILEPKKFANDSGAKNIRILTILGMLLFGCFPFLIPFAIVWAIVKSKSNNATSGRVKETKKEEEIVQKSNQISAIVGSVAICFLVLVFALISGFF